MHIKSDSLGKVDTAREIGSVFSSDERTNQVKDVLTQDTRTSARHLADETLDLLRAET